MTAVTFRAKPGTVTLLGVSGIHKYSNNRYRGLQTSPESEIEGPVQESKQRDSGVEGSSSSAWEQVEDTGSGSQAVGAHTGY